MSTFEPWSFVNRLDEIRAELSDLASRLPEGEGDARMCVKSAKDSLAMAQDIVEAGADE